MLCKKKETSSSTSATHNKEADRHESICFLVVRETRLELVRCEPHAPQTCASASSATPAYCCCCEQQVYYTRFLRKVKGLKEKSFFQKEFFKNLFLAVDFFLFSCYNTPCSGCSAVGSAPGLGPGCRRFESCHSDQTKTSPQAMTAYIS